MKKKDKITRRKVVIASNNPHKIEEIKKVLTDYDFYSLKDMGIDFEIVEDQDSFLLNAIKKADGIYRVTGLPTLADDAGICIPELGGYPGVDTQKLYGKESLYLSSNNLLISEADKTETRSAYVMCDIVYFDGDTRIISEGRLDGRITHELRGTHGFGFDPIFEVGDKTLAEMEPEEKGNISARHLALVDLHQKLSAQKK